MRHQRGDGEVAIDHGRPEIAPEQPANIGEELLAQRLVQPIAARQRGARSEEHTSELQSLMRISYAVFCLQKKKKKTIPHIHTNRAEPTIQQHNKHINS